MLQAKDICVELDSAKILENVSVCVAPGEVVAVLGPNGAGKSTLLKVLSGVLEAQKGTASLDGKPVRDWRPHLIARKRAVMAQHSELAFGFRTLEVVLLGRSPHAGVRAHEEDLAIAKSALIETETLHLADRIFTTLSGGERQRVQLARVLTQIDFIHPQMTAGERYLLLDEPTSSLDLSHQHATLTTARRAADRGIGVLTILHDLNLAAMYADRVVILHGGRMCAVGVPDKVFTAETIDKAFNLSVNVTRHPNRDCPYVIAM